MKELRNVQAEVLPAVLRVVFYAILVPFIIFIFLYYNSSYQTLLTFFYIPLVLLLALAAFVSIFAGVVRISIILTVLHLFGYSELVLYGYNSLGFFLLLAASLAGIIGFDRKLGWGSLFISILITVVIAIAHFLNIIPVELLDHDVLVHNHWLLPITLYVVVSTAIIAVVDNLMKRLGLEIRQVESARAELVKKNAELTHMAYMDPITDLLNSRAIERDFSDDIELLDGDEIQIILLDIINFDKINIKYGIESGNAVLKETAERLLSLGCFDVYRAIGNRFILKGKIECIPEMKQNIDKEIQSILSGPFKIEEFFITIQYVGTKILYPTDIDDIRHIASSLMLMLPDPEKMIKDEIVPFSSDRTASINRLNRISDMLAESINTPEIETYIQPKLCLSTGEISGGELLLRWNNKVLGSVSPEDFIPVAEKNRMIIPLTHKVMSDAVRLTGMLSPQNPKGRSERIAVNISPLIIHGSELSNMTDYLQFFNNGVSLEFELTEGFFLGSNDYIENSLDVLHQKGIKISIDDFGTGYSNIEYLQYLQIDALKIDKRFISGLPEDSKQTALVSAIIALSKELGQTIVAEGVENKEQLNWLREQGVEEIQGYYFAKPMTFSNYIEFRKKHDPLKWK